MKFGDFVTERSGNCAIMKILREKKQGSGYRNGRIEGKFKEDIEMAVIKLTAENFEQEVMKADKTVLVDFYADWCGPCQMLSPIVDEVAEERDDIKVGKINVDEQMTLAQRYGVMTIPTLIVFKNGEIANKQVGAQSKSGVLKML